MTQETTAAPPVTPEWWLEWAGTDAGTGAVVNERPPAARKRSERPKEARPVRNYSYGALEPTSGLDAVKLNLFLRCRLRNDLVRLERERRAAVDEARAMRDNRHPEIGELRGRRERLRGEIERLRGEINAERAAARKNVPCHGKKARIRQLQAHDRQVGKDLAAAYKAAGKDPQYAAALERAGESKEDKWKATYYDHVRDGLSSHTARTVGGTVKTAWDQEPRFGTFDGTGTVYVQRQTQSGKEYLTPFRAHKGDKEIRIDRTDHPRRFVLHLKIDSRPKAPSWVTVPMTMHRPLPADAVITWVMLRRTQLAGRYRYRVVFTLERAAGWDEPRPAGAAGKVCAVNFGWRAVAGGVRVATWVDGGDRRVGEVVVPKSRALPSVFGRRLPLPAVAAWKKVEELQSVRDRLFNRAKATVSRWLQWFSARGGRPPDWWEEQAATLSAWKSPARLARLVLFWREHRFAGDAKMFSLLDQPPLGKGWRKGQRHYTAWRNQDKHLWHWQAHLRDQLIACRADCYRQIAYELWRNFGEVRLADVDWAQLRVEPPPEEDESVSALYRNLASPGLLDRFVRERCRPAVYDAKNLTWTCHVCKKLCKPAAAARRKRLYRCEHCGSEWDVDVNHCRNLLRATDKDLADADSAARRARGAQAEDGKPVGAISSDAGDNGES